MIGRLGSELVTALDVMRLMRGDNYPGIQNISTGETREKTQPCVSDIFI